jgi:hypothetical protein
MEVWPDGGWWYQHFETDGSVVRALTCTFSVERAKGIEPS